MRLDMVRDIDPRGAPQIGVRARTKVALELGQRQLGAHVVLLLGTGDAEGAVQSPLDKVAVVGRMDLRIAARRTQGRAVALQVQGGGVTGGGDDASVWIATWGGPVSSRQSSQEGGS
jgi:hypothetical protein